VNAGYTEIYYDNIETPAPRLGPGFTLESAGSWTSNPSEVIAGTESVKGSYSGTSTFTVFLQTNASVIPLTSGHTYQASFQYKILTAAANGFQASFFSPTALSQKGNGAAPGGAQIKGAAGTTGTATIMSTLGSYTDYSLLWGINGSGAISINNIQITDQTTGVALPVNVVNQAGPGPALQLNGAQVTTDPTLVLDGTASLRLTNSQGLSIKPSVVPLAANTTYIIQFQYKVLKIGTATQILNVSLAPAGTNPTPQTFIFPTGMLFNAPATGVFSTGSQTSAGAQTWMLQVSNSSDSDIVIDDISIFRLDATQTIAMPPTWNNLSTRPYPRIGQYTFLSTMGLARFGGVEGPAFNQSVNQIENTLAFADVISGLTLNNQTQYPDSIRRLRQLNPDMVILGDRTAYEQSAVVTPTNAATDLNYSAFQGIPNSWYVNTAEGQEVSASGTTNTGFMNISGFCPMVNGQTYTSYINNFITGSVFSSGVWDGVLLDLLTDHLFYNFPNYMNPSSFDFDFNGNGMRDETLASTNDMLRAGTTAIAQGLRNQNGNLQLILGNPGVNSASELALAPYLNGFVMPCQNIVWNPSTGTMVPFSVGNWRMAWENYQSAQALLQSPAVNVIQGCGPSSMTYSTPTANDLQIHRFTMGTALLNGAFYGFALHGQGSEPLWMDEYSVDANGIATENLNYKGYLGQALTNATELTTPGSIVLQENFARNTLPQSFDTGSGVSFSNGSMIISNPDHTSTRFAGTLSNPKVVKLTAGTTYLLSFDWTILQSLDGPLYAQVLNAIGSNGGSSALLPTIDVSGIMRSTAGDSGTANFPFTMPASIQPGQWGFEIFFIGGGQVGIKNVRLTSGGVGPWRRDFENGFVLVNPLSTPHTFSAADLAGTLNRTGIHRINGTQAPTINNGQPVTGSLTLQPFDAIILLADPMPLPGTQTFQITDRSGVSQTTSGSNSSVQVGFANIIPYEGSTPSGLAIFDFRQNGVLISEAAVPASPLILNGRTYAEIAGPVDTGIAIANPGSQDAMVYFYYTDATGANILTGSVPVPANTQISAFLDQAPFVSQPTDLSSVRAFTFSSTVPVGVVALRGYTNERNEFLITTLPIDPLTTTSTTAFAFPHYADGGGWTSALVLLNPTDSTITGTAQFYSKGTATTAGAPVSLVANGTSASSFSYTIAPRSSVKLQTAGSGSSVQTGWVNVTPASGSVAPSGLVVFSYDSNGVRASEAGVPALPSSTAFRMYAESSSSIQTGVAISNPGSSNVAVNFDLTNLDGSSTGLTGTTTVPATGQIAMFLNQIPGFSAPSSSFEAVLRISGANVYVTGLRGRYNERGDFLITTTAPVDEKAAPSPAELVFPQLAAGGGYTTQIILFSGTAGQSATGVLQFVSQSGQPLILSFQ
jgi:hypothetical protein